MSNQSTLVEQMFGRVAQYGYAIGRGKDAFADMARDVYRVVRDDHETDVDLVKPFYIEVRATAERDAIAGGKPLKEQPEKSRNVQINKLENFAHVAKFARENSAVDIAFDYALSLVAGGYTKLVKCAVAMKTELGKHSLATETTLCAAIDAALAETPELASAAVGKIEDAWEKLAHGDKSGPSPHAEMLSKLLAAYPQDYVKHIGQCLTDARVMLEKIEAQANEPAAKWSV
jgi:hypothetical protein